MDYYAHGGKGSTSDILKFLGQEDMLGKYYALYNSGGGEVDLVLKTALDLE